MADILDCQGGAVEFGWDDGNGWILMRSPSPSAVEIPKRVTFVDLALYCQVLILQEVKRQLYKGWPHAGGGLS